MKLSKVLTILNTVKYLKPVQIFSQIKSRIPEHKTFDSYGEFKGRIRRPDMYIKGLDDDEGYLSRFDTGEILDGRITLLHHTAPLDGSFQDAGATHLFNFNQHYFEYAIPIAVAFGRTGDEKYKNRISELYGEWYKISKTNSDASHPYTISLRIINLLVSASLTGDTDIVTSLYPQYRYLINHQEKNLLGNHYFENLKTVVTGSLIFNEDNVYRRYIRQFLNELDKQILPDGVHCELSPMYHKIVLEGLMRTAYLLKQCGKSEYGQLLPYISRMVTALSSLENGMGKTPFFNDSADGVAKDGKSLLYAANTLFGIFPEDKAVFSDSGYYKLYDRDIALMFDCGRIGPDYMPGHGHCDCLSFELSVNNAPLFVNSGTYKYQCDRRSYFRSTAAHNTLLLDGREQSECWGEHRVARRVMILGAKADNESVTGTCRSFHGDVYTRNISLTNRCLTVTDKVSGTGQARSFLHLADGYKHDGMKILRGDKVICTVIPLNCNVTVHTNDIYSAYSPEFGLLTDTFCFEFIWDTDNGEHGYKVQFEEHRTDTTA